MIKNGQKSNLKYLPKCCSVQESEKIPSVLKQNLRELFLYSPAQPAGLYKNFILTI